MARARRLFAEEFKRKAVGLPCAMSGYDVARAIRDDEALAGCRSDQGSQFSSYDWRDS